MKPRFVHYYVVGVKQCTTSDGKSFPINVRVSGVVRDTKDKLGKIFQQNQKLLGCHKIAHQSYHVI